MSAFDSQFVASATPALLHAFADDDAFTLVAADGTQTTVDAIVGDEEIERRPDQRGLEVAVHVRTVMISADDLARNRVTTNATAIVESIRYQVVRVGDDSTGCYDVDLERLAVGELGREGYRRR